MLRLIEAFKSKILLIMNTQFKKNQQSWNIQVSVITCPFYLHPIRFCWEENHFLLQKVFRPISVARLHKDNFEAAYLFLRIVSFFKNTFLGRLPQCRAGQDNPWCPQDMPGPVAALMFKFPSARTPKVPFSMVVLQPLTLQSVHTSRVITRPQINLSISEKSLFSTKHAQVYTSYSAKTHHTSGMCVMIFIHPICLCLLSPTKH